MLAPLWAAPVASDDHQSLETDVMRFMAILGFCLMAVFALIQAIPVSQQSGGVGLQSSALLAAQVQQLQDELAQLGVEAARLKAQAELQEHQLQQLADSNRQYQTQLAKVMAQAQTVAERVVQSQIDSERLRQQLAQDAGALDQTQQALAKLQRQANRDAAKLSRSAQQLETLRHQLNSAEKAPSAESAPLPAAPVQPVKPSPRKLTSKATQPGPLTMRFQSTAALERLVAGGQTVLFAIVGDRAWRSVPSGRFVASTKPNKPYQLTESPGQRLLQQFRRDSGLLTANGVQWWVSLDAQLVQRLSRMLQQHQSGQLVIQGDGTLLHEPGLGPTEAPR